jgi:hypothetical protein
MVPLFPDRQRDRQTVAGRRKRASRIGRVGARRIFQVIKVEQQFARLIYTVIWKRGVQKSARRVSGFRAGSIPQNEKQLRIVGIFQNRF